MIQNRRSGVIFLGGAWGGAWGKGGAESEADGGKDEVLAQGRCQLDTFAAPLIRSPVTLLVLLL